MAMPVDGMLSTVKVSGDFRGPRRVSTVTVAYGKGFAPVRSQAEKVDFLETEFLKQPQVECPVIHRFGPGIYIREVRIPAGALAIGHRQKREHLNVFLQGRVAIVNDDGTTTELAAPFTFVGRPGRKVGYVHEDVIWQNVYATDETDLAKLEQMFFERSDGWHAGQQGPQITCDADVADYHRALSEFGFTDDIARQQSEDESDQIPFPLGGYKVTVAPSSIEGKGLFATAPIAAGELIAPARIGGKRTPAGRFTNHATVPNARMVMREDGDIDLVATAPIRGCTGGANGDEITIDYRAALRLQIKEK